jgi:hypothetical protein
MPAQAAPRSQIFSEPISRNVPEPGGMYGKRLALPRLCFCAALTSKKTAAYWRVHLSKIAGKFTGTPYREHADFDAIIANLYDFPLWIARVYYSAGHRNRIPTNSSSLYTGTRMDTNDGSISRY